MGSVEVTRSSGDEPDGGPARRTHGMFTVFRLSDGRLSVGWVSQPLRHGGARSRPECPNALLGQLAAHLKALPTRLVAELPETCGGGSCLVSVDPISVDGESSWLVTLHERADLLVHPPEPRAAAV